MYIMSHKNKNLAKNQCPLYTETQSVYCLIFGYTCILQGLHVE